MERSDFHFATKLTGKQKRNKQIVTENRRKMKKMQQKKI